MHVSAQGLSCKDYNINVLQQTASVSTILARIRANFACFGMFERTFTYALLYIYILLCFRSLPKKL